MSELCESWRSSAAAVTSISLNPTFFIAKTQQQRFKLINCLLFIGPDRLEDDTGAAIQIGSKHFQQAGGREMLLAFPNRDCALEPDYAPDKQRRRSRVQPELVDNFDFFAHAENKRALGTETKSGMRSQTVRPIAHIQRLSGGSIS
jgi:hypothetical protein